MRAETFFNFATHQESVGSSFGAVYGPLAGMFALLLWALFTSMALFYGAAVCAQLEACRAGQPGAQLRAAVIPPSTTAPMVSVGIGSVCSDTMSLLTLI